MVLWTLLVVGYVLSTWSLKRQERFEPCAVWHARSTAHGAPIALRRSGRAEEKEHGSMKKIEATVPPFMLDEVRDALVGVGADGMSVTEVKVVDGQARIACYRGSSYEVPFSPQCKLEIVVENEQVGRCLDAVRALLARSHAAAEIVVLPLADSVRIRTGQHLSRAA